MPIYEFYCSACHALFNFFSSTVDTEKRPDCPRCQQPGLERKPARFATLSAAGDRESEIDSLDDARMERAMQAMAQELESAGDDEDPKQMARLMRRFGEAAGLAPGPEMEAAIARLEAGDDPDRIEEELGALGDGEGGIDDLFQLKATTTRRRRNPRLDDELFFL